MHYLTTTPTDIVYTILMDEKQLREDKESKTHISQTRPRNIMTVALLIASVLLLSLAGRQLVDRRNATSGIATPPDNSHIVTEDVSEPDESKVNTDDYHVPPDQPRVISIPKINASGPIQKVGVTKDNAIAAPTNVQFAGWYVSGVKPGDNGLSIIDGHVSGKYSDGIFKQLHTLTSGDSIIVEYGDGSQKKFEVLDVATLPEKDAAQYLLSKRDDIDQQLNLITCGGAFLRDTQTYADRTIIVAQLVE